MPPISMLGKTTGTLRMSLIVWWPSRNSLNIVALKTVFHWPTVELVLSAMV